MRIICIIYKNRIKFVNNCIIMALLYTFLWFYDTNYRFFHYLYQN